MRKFIPLLALLLTSCTIPTDTAAPESTTTTSAAPEPLTVTIAAAGDLLIHSPVSFSAADGTSFDYTRLFQGVTAPFENADLSICHMEGPLSPDNTNVNTGVEMIFNFPFEVARDAKAIGFDGCEFASNHTIDQGLQGLKDTEDVIRKYDLGYAGPTMYEETAGKPAVYEAGDATVAHFAYTYTYPNSGGPTEVIPDGAPWLKENLWPVLGAEGILEQAKKPRTMARTLWLPASTGATSTSRNPTKANWILHRSCWNPTTWTSS